MIPLLIIIFLILLLFELKFSQVHKTVFFILALLLWWFLESFRWESGTDFYNYYNTYKALSTERILTHRFELGYNVMVIFFRNYLDASFYVFNAIYHFILFTLYYFSVKKVTDRPLIFLFIFFCFSVGLMGSTRQLMALSIMFFGTVFFLENKKLWFIVIILLASMFHKTIIVCLIFLLFNNNIKYKFWLFLILFAFIVQLTGLNSLINEIIIQFLPESFSDKYFGYLSLPSPDNTAFPVFMAGIFKRSLPIILFIFYKEKLILLNKNKEYIINILFFSLFAYIFLSFNFTFIISRISVYFNIFEAVFYTWLITILFSEKKYFFPSMLFLFFILLCIRYTMSYPELFFPYKTIFFTL